MGTAMVWFGCGGVWVIIWAVVSSPGSGLIMEVKAAALVIAGAAVMMRG
jgi:hypothetical protein